MKYLFVQDWSSTRGNHAGMVHMCNLLCSNYPLIYKMVVMPESSPSKSDNPFILLYRKIINKFFLQITWRRKYKRISKAILEELKNGDEIFLLEYMLPTAPQFSFALYLRKKYSGIRIYALSHLTPTYFTDQSIYPKLIENWSKPIDKFLTLGTSLSQYFISQGIQPDRISTGFHYVDNKYYYKSIDSLKISSRPKVITMGNMQRDYRLIADIVKLTPDADWIICKGRKNVGSLFDYFPNVTLKGYIEEKELKCLMSQADISLNVMNDTVGSNVITTSLAMGLVMLVSDVGSIRDYCSEQNTIFCKNTPDSFSTALNSLLFNREKMLLMKKNSILKSQELTIEHVHEWFSNIN